jgi:hypothetical protein
LHTLNIKRISIAITCVTILLSAFLFSIVYSAQNVSFGLLQKVKISWKDGDFTVSIPFYVRNYGFYNIENVNIFFELKDSTGQTLTRSVNSIGTIKAGSELKDYLNITIQPINLFLGVLLHQMLQNGALELHAAAHLNYALSLLTLEAEASIIITPELVARELFQLMVNDVTVNFNNSLLQLNNESIAITLPFSLKYNGQLIIENFELNIEAKNSKGSVVVLGKIFLHKLRQGENAGSLNLTLNKEIVTCGLTCISEFTIHLKANLNGFTFEWTKNIDYRSES